MSRSTGRPRPATNSQGQASVEFMILFIIFLVAITAAMVTSVNRSYEVSMAQIRLETTDLLRDITGKVNTAYLQGDGFSSNITVPDDILGMNYTVSIMSNEVVINIGPQTFIDYMITTNVTGTPVIGTNRVTNRNGEIIITLA